MVRGTGCTYLGLGGFLYVISTISRPTLIGWVREERSGGMENCVVAFGGGARRGGPHQQATRQVLPGPRFIGLRRTRSAMKGLLTKLNTTTPVRTLYNESVHHRFHSVTSLLLPRCFPPTPTRKRRAAQGYEIHPEAHACCMRAKHGERVRPPPSTLQL